MADRLIGVWLRLAETPLLWLTLTLAVYQVASWLYRRSNSLAVLNPVLLSILLVVALLLVTGTPYGTYFEGAQLIHFLLGPATVALAIPLYEHMGELREASLPILVALPLGCVVALCSAVGMGWLLGASGVTLLSLAPKSITTPIAIGVSEAIGGVPSLTAVFVILTGIIGAVTAKSLLDLLRVEDPSARGFAIGLSSHGIGTARAFQMSEEAGALSGLAMGLNGTLTAFLAPILVRLLNLG
jgi:predicted murein hydrolase (TIGR00659 family)